MNMKVIITKGDEVVGEFESETRTTKSITYTINATHTTLYKVECKKGYQFK